MLTKVLTPGAPEWSVFLDETAHDFYHLGSYLSFTAGLEGAEPCAILVEEHGMQLLLPFLRRANSLDRKLWDATSPYGYPGPLVRGAPTHDDANSFAGRAIDVASAHLASLGCTSVFVRMHPLLPLAPRPKSGCLVEHGETVYVDLRKSEEQLWRETASGHRNEINRSLRSGHIARFDDDFSNAARFVEIYQSTMRRVGAPAYYLFDADYVAGLRRALGPRLKLVVVEIGREVAAAALFVRTGDIVQYHLSGTDINYIRERPTKLLLHFVRAWARRTGAAVLHLGGGVGGQADSLFNFKAAFSPLRARFHTLRIVTDDARYRELSGLDGCAPLELDRFFPAYRK